MKPIKRIERIYQDFLKLRDEYVREYGYSDYSQFVAFVNDNYVFNTFSELEDSISKTKNLLS